MIRLLLVEDQPSLRKALEMALGVEPDVEVVGVASDCGAALRAAASLTPDVVLMDIDMLRLDRVSMGKALVALCPRAPVIVLSFHDDNCTREVAAAAGASAFVAKALPVDTLVASIRQVARQRLSLSKGG